MQQRRICVLGAGIIGLSSAVAIQEKLKSLPVPSHVTLIADRFSPDTTSDGSGGFWEAHFVNADDPELIQLWGNQTFDHLQSLSLSPLGGDLGIHFVSGYSFLDNNGYGTSQIGLRTLNEKETKYLHPDGRRGVSYTTIMVNVTKYLAFLTKKFLQAGGSIQQKKITNIDKLGVDFDTVVNCCGLGSQELLQDDQLTPMRGQTIRVHAPWIKHFYIDVDPTDPTNEIYILPGSDEVILGGTSQKGNWDTTVREADRKRIWNGCCRLVPSLQHAKVTREWVGLRPKRSVIKCSGETIQISTEKELFVVHNYGHGGSGVTLSWGCALTVADMVLKRTNLRAKL